MIAVDYAPYGQLLPRAKLTVHAGGIGATGQALRAGKPMLVVPFAHDQFDNGARIARLGIGHVLVRTRYTARRAAYALDRLLRDPSYAARAATLGRQVQKEQGIRTACDAIEARLA